MEGETFVNGDIPITTVDSPVADGGDADGAEALKRRIEFLEEENHLYAEENKKGKEKVELLTSEVKVLTDDRAKLESDLEELRLEVGRAEEDKRALGAIASRAAVLEAEVVRLNEEFIAALSAGEDSASELAQLKVDFAELEKSGRERDSKVADLEKERAYLEEQKAEMETRLRGFESKIRDSESLEASLKAEILKREGEIMGLKRELEEKDALISAVEERLRISKEKVAVMKKELSGKNGEREVEVEELMRKVLDYEAMEEKVLRFEKELEAAATRMKENGVVSERAVKGKCSEYLSPAVVASAGTFAAVAVGATVVYLRYHRN
ncbi:hypothetical protein QJS10_CPB14g00560 [Acorus calamus]|uniref:Uncharacterized protein n=1 Tax=Acorus calamus TaxID=4465 RepID=A0AAV9DEX7_ACOCL|nr:hypothetical protein QJS10_CPB14g00560 [Acorus calamus]